VYYSKLPYNVIGYVRPEFRKRNAGANPARIPPQTPPAGGKKAEAEQFHSPRQIVSPCLVRISIFNHLDFARKTFELCPADTALWKIYFREKVCSGQPLASSNLATSAKIINGSTLRVGLSRLLFWQ